MKPVLKKSEVLKLINEGYTRPELAEHFQISVIEMRRIIKEFNITEKAKKRSYDLVDDTVTESSTSSPIQNTANSNPLIY